MHKFADATCYVLQRSAAALSLRMHVHAVWARHYPSLLLLDGLVALFFRQELDGVLVVLHC